MNLVEAIDSLEIPSSGKSQVEWVKEKLARDGYVTRNEAEKVKGAL